MFRILVLLVAMAAIDMLVAGTLANHLANVSFGAGGMGQ